MKVRDIMTTDVETASPDTTLQQIATMMKEQDVGSIPIVDGDELVGIVTDRDIVVRCIAAAEDPSEVRAEDVVSGDLQTIEPEQEVEEAARIMSQHQIRRLPVVNDGELVGMIALGDIAVKEDEDTAGDALEEISEGVKGKRQGASKSQGKKQPVRASGGSSARGRDESSTRGRHPKRAAAGSSGRRRRAG